MTSANVSKVTAGMTVQTSASKKSGKKMSRKPLILCQC